jgi:membrane protein
MGRVRHPRWDACAVAISTHLDRAQQRFPVLGFPIATIYKFGDDFGNYLAAVLTYYAFVSILPLLLLGSTVLSVVLVGHPHLQTKLLNSALASFPVVGRQLSAPSALSGGTTGVIIGVAAATYGSLGVAQALQYAGNTIWGVPRNRRPNPFLARARSLLLVATAGTGMLIALAASIYFHTVFGTDTFGSRSGGFVVGAIVYALVLLVAFRLAVKKRVGVTVLLPGALFAAAGLQLLQSFGYSYVAHVIRHATDVNAVFATFLGLLAYLYVAAVLVVFAMEINAVRTQRLWPRALLTPFTDAVDLTRADRAAYSQQARAQRTKGYEEIAVVFHPRPVDTPAEPAVPKRPDKPAPPVKDADAGAQ